MHFWVSLKQHVFTMKSLQRLVASQTFNILINPLTLQIQFVPTNTTLAPICFVLSYYDSIARELSHNLLSNPLWSSTGRPVPGGTICQPTCPAQQCIIQNGAPNCRSALRLGPISRPDSPHTVTVKLRWFDRKIVSLSTD